MIKFSSHFHGLNLCPTFPFFLLLTRIIFFCYGLLFSCFYEGLLELWPWGRWMVTTEFCDTIRVDKVLREKKILYSTPPFEQAMNMYNLRNAGTYSDTTENTETNAELNNITGFFLLMMKTPSYQYIFISYLNLKNKKPCALFCI